MSVVAGQRVMLAQGLMMQLGALSRQIGEMIDTSIRCAPNDNAEISCDPEPSLKLASVLPQLLSVAHEAQRYGVSETPFIMNFGLGRSIEIVFARPLTPL